MGTPHLRLRPLTAEEEQILAEKVADKGLPPRIHERYRLITLVGDGATPAAASRIAGCGDGKAEHWVHRFSASGFATFEKSPGRTGRPAVIDGQQVRALIRVALSRPEDLGLPFTQWSVSRLRATQALRSSSGLRTRTCAAEVVTHLEPPHPVPRRKLCCVARTEEFRIDGVCRKLGNRIY